MKLRKFLLTNFIIIILLPFIVSLTPIRNEAKYLQMSNSISELNNTYNSSKVLLNVVNNKLYISDISYDMILKEKENISIQQRLLEEEHKKQEMIAQIDSIKVNPNNISIISNMTPEQLDTVFEHTWLYGMGEYFYILERNYSINALFAASVAIQEVGRNISSNYRATNNKNIFGIMVGKTKFNTYKDCILYFGDFISRLYINKGLLSVDTISKKYCIPGSEHWSKQVKSIMNEFKIQVDNKIKLEF